MSRLAAIAMFLAWLLYGAMPAIATPLMPVSLERPAAAKLDHTQHHNHGKHGHGQKVETAKTTHVHGDAQQPCPHGAKACTAPFCVACVTLPPEIAIDDDSRFAYAYPAPAIGQVFISPAPAPLTPPPRV